MTFRRFDSDLTARLTNSASRIPVWVDATFVSALCVLIALAAYNNGYFDLRVPLVTGGDAASAQYFMKTVLDFGWYTRNTDIGAPFGASMYDYPIPEPTHFLLVRLLGLSSNDPFVVFNLFYFFSFASASLSAWWALRQLGIARPLAIAGALLFSILPYHFLRLQHVYLASYFAAPIFSMYALQLALYRAPHLPEEIRWTWTSALLIAIAAGSGVYYAFFGCLFLAAGALLGAIQARRREPLMIGAAGIAIIVTVIALSLLPNAMYHLVEGSNPLVAGRVQQEAEIYGLRISHMLLPTWGHRIGWMAAITNSYVANSPLFNESAFAALGLIASFGIVTAILAALFAPRERFPTLTATGILSLVGILFATFGGVGALFALLVTPELRGLNRISVFIAFFAIFSAMSLAAMLVKTRPWLGALVAAGIMIIGWVDQIPVYRIIHSNPADFLRQQAFFDKIQAELPAGTPIYELPYMFFPESPALGNLSSYGLLEPYLRTRGLRWSFGEMHGRPSDVWNEKVSTLNGPALIDALAGSGFGAIYVDRRGYRGASVDSSLSAALGPPIAEDAVRNIALYRLPHEVAGQSVPFVVVGFGRGWHPEEKTAKGDPLRWSKESADLLVLNPSHAVPLDVAFNATTVQTRHLRISYGNQQLGDYVLQPGSPHKIKLKLQADAGVSKLRIDTDTPPTVDVAHAKRPISFQIGDLTYDVVR